MEVAKKILICGDSDSGKNSLFHNLTDLEAPFSDDYLNTIGAVIGKYILKENGNKLTLMVWDVTEKIRSGELYPGVRENYTKGSEGALIVADGTNATSIANIYKWKGELEEYLGEVPLAIVVTHMDQLTESQVTELDQVLGGEFDTPYFLTSIYAKKEFNPDEPIEYLAHKLVERMLN